MAERSASFALEEADVVAAAKLAVSRRLPLRIEWLVVIAVLAGALGLWLSTGGGDPLLKSLSIAVIAAAIAVVLVYRLFVTWQARRHFRQLAAARGTTTFDWNEEGTVITASKGESRLAWSDYHAWAESGQHLLLFQSHLLYNLVPTRALDEAQLADIRGYLAQAGVRRR